MDYYAQMFYEISTIPKIIISLNLIGITVLGIHIYYSI